MSSALHLVLTVLLWLSMGLWPVGADPLAREGEHASRHDQHAPDIGNTSESEPIEIEDDEDTATTTRQASAPARVSSPRATNHHVSPTRAREISMVGAGNIRGPPAT